MKVCFGLGFAALALAASPAFAQDEADTAFSGPYVGGLAGIDSVRLSDGVDSGSDEALMYGIVAGYDVDVGQMVVGLEGEFSDSSVSQSETSVITAGDRMKLAAGRDLYIGGRVGYKTGSLGLVYAKVGYTNASVKLAYDDGTTAISASDELDGFRLGAGGEFGLNQNLFIRAEYRYSDYGEYSYAGIATGVSAQRHQGVVSLIGKF